MKTYAILGLTLWLLPSAALAQSGPVKVNLDYAVFPSDASGMGDVNLYLAFDAASLSWTSDSTMRRASVPMHLDVFSAVGDSLLTSEDVDLDFALPLSTELRDGQYLLHCIRSSIEAGKYKIQARFGAETKPAIYQEFNVPDFSTTPGVSKSDLVLATSVKAFEVGDDSTFVRNGLVIRPNPKLVFGSGLQELHYYAELYLNVDASPVVARAFVADANGDRPLVGYLHEVDVRESRHLTGVFDMGVLPSGSYTMNLDPGTGKVDRRRFFVYNPGVTEKPAVTLENFDEEMAEAPTLSSTMTDEELKGYVDQIRELASKQEARALKSLKTREEREQFFETFWRKRDSRAGLPDGESETRFLGLVGMANDRYGNGRRDGWKTDRGRVLLRYGMYDSIDSQPYGGETAPYEVWQYGNVEGVGQALFVFADVNGYNLYELIHSTAPGERKSMDWQAEIRRGR